MKKTEPVFKSIVSGSSGNCSFISDGETSILIDCGLSGKKLELAFESIGFNPADLSAILVTHEHIDHVCGAGVFARRYNLDIFATEGTHNFMQIGAIRPEKRINIEPDSPFEIGGITVTPFSIPHDAADPVGYTMTVSGKKLTLATDIGYMTKGIINRIEGSDMVLLEANHDIEMLNSGPYPQQLKRRILGRLGHLSNDYAAKTAHYLASNGTKKIMLAHLSHENNTPELAYDTVLEQLEKANSQTSLCVASRYEVTDFI